MAEVVASAVALDHLRPTEACTIVRDDTGRLFVRATTDEDVVHPDDGAAPRPGRGARGGPRPLPAKRPARC